MIKNFDSRSSLPSILIVDDNPKNLQLLGKVLQENKYHIEFSTNGKAALEFIKIKKFDLILLDINMPGLSGFEVCAAIRSDPEMNNVPIIFLTASVDRESILKGFEIGAQDYITKPFDSRELLVRVRTHLVLKESLENLEKFNKVLEERVNERTLQLKVSNEKLEASNKKLLELDKAKAGFLNLISHEIRTPLNGMIGPLSLLKGPQYASIESLVNILDISVKRLERFSLDALLITGLQTRRIALKNDKIHLLNLINQVIKEEKEIFLKRNIQVNSQSDLNPGIITGDADLIKKCFVNILRNAARFSPENGLIQITHYSNEKGIICEIKDRGKGFKKDSDQHVFELFTTDEEYKDNCIGLGLPVTRMIMEFHHGNISIGNNPEGGAIVKLIFPKEYESN
jgi:two-component system sensor histidine kinase/response regulator